MEEATGVAAIEDEPSVTPPSLGDDDSMGTPPAEENAAVDVGSMGYGGTIEA